MRRPNKKSASFYGNDVENDLQKKTVAMLRKDAAIALKTMETTMADNEKYMTKYADEYLHVDFSDEIRALEGFIGGMKTLSNNYGIRSASKQAKADKA